MEGVTLPQRDGGINNRQSLNRPLFRKENLMPSLLSEKERANNNLIDIFKRAGRLPRFGGPYSPEGVEASVIDPRPKSSQLRTLSLTCEGTGMAAPGQCLFLLVGVRGVVLESLTARATPDVINVRCSLI
jgi:hypothetical protein